MSSAPPKTPPRTGAPDATVNSTPISVGSGTNAAYSLNTRQREYAAFLHEDLQHEKTISFEEFCKIIFNFDPDSEATIHLSAAQSEALGGLRTSYTEPVPDEFSRYQPFCEWANYLLESSGSDYRLCRNDPTYLWGTYAFRKPDVLTASENSLTRDLDRMSVDNLAANGPSESPFHPTEAMGFWEFKLNRRDLTREQDRVTKPTPYTPPPNVKPNAKPVSQAILSGSGPTSSKKRKAEGDPPVEGSGPRKSQRTTSSNFVPKPMSVHPADAQLLDVADDEDTPQHPLTQCASYALELISYGLRQHVFGFLITDAQVEFLYYDRSILLRSAPFNFVDNSENFAKTLIHLGKMPITEWGFRSLIPDLGPVPNPKLLKPGNWGRGAVGNLFEGKTLGLKNGCQLQLGEIVHQAHGLRGRGTLVLKATPLHRPDWPEEVVVKLIWRPKSRKPEWEILNIINEAIKHPDDHWVRDHLPTLLHHEDIEDDVEISTRLAARFPNEYEERILSLQVFTVLKSMSDLRSDGVALPKVFSDTVKCHQWVSDVAGVLHRDISVRNLMYRENDKGELVGVLNDWDLASPISELHKGPASAQRTGTRPYMAIELIKNHPPPLHTKGHDLESFFYVLCHLFCDSQTEIGLWSTLSNSSLTTAKRAIFASPIQDYLMPQHRGLDPGVYELKQLFLRTRIDPPRGSPSQRVITGDAFLRALHHTL